MANGLLKWAAAAAASGILLVAVVPAIATDSQTKLLSPTHSPKSLIATATPVGKAKTHKLTVHALKSKKLTKTKHVVSKLHTKTKIKSAHKHKTTTLDKSSKIKSIM